MTNTDAYFRFSKIDRLWYYNLVKFGLIL